jgi:aminoglycoside/choline kinase family phosphotransferase
MTQPRLAPTLLPPANAAAASVAPSDAPHSALDASPVSDVTDHRLAALRTWLAAQSLADGMRLDLSSLAPASSDAGFRRYFRVQADLPASGTDSISGTITLIAMDAPPPEKSREFVQIQALMADAGVRVPTILSADVDHGFMLLSDLGNTSYLQALQADGADARGMMRSALDTLIQWQQASAAGVLPDYDDAFLRREMNLFPEWYLTRHLGLSIDDATRRMLDKVFDTLVDSALAQPKLFVHRDFMPRNLMVVDLSPAVIDFQDAVMGPATYDVVSLFRDAFLSWDEPFELDGIAWYWGRAKAAGLPVQPDFAQYYRELEWMGLQRHLKILGLFARLHYRDGKTRYLDDAPRFIAYARKVAGRYRELTPLARLLDKISGHEPSVGYTF